MREDIMYVIVYPDGLIAMNTQKYFKSFCIKEWCKGGGPYMEAMV